MKMIKIIFLCKPRVDPMSNPGRKSDTNQSETLGGDLPNMIDITWYKMEGANWLNSSFTYRQTSMYDAFWHCSI